ncbi:hypothetical protein G3R48_03265 [Shewanella intestini]|uniref:Peptidoglycan-binding protein CsiV n=2 Tax=Shewanellaceae TaxID=267890 RepID=A0ABS5HYZ3_9GAMM|nr:peptidoglycan binding protein CsiV [Shewanella intestini]MBR9727013.1 hypothetical protein [Shewanella intestini]MRG35814.1 hypothetical protein [Shewanella sp. XMDDZSB0408]
MQRRFTLSCVAIACLCQPMAAQAKTWFEVEVFVFERPAQSTSEQWNEQPAKALNSQAVDLISPMITTDITGVSLGLSGCNSNDWLNDNHDCNDPLTNKTQKSHPSVVPVSIAAPTEQVAYLGEPPVLLAESQAQFSDMIASIKKERGITPLIHMTWQQDMKTRRLATPVRIFGGKDFSDEYTFHGEPVINHEQDNISAGLTDFSSYGDLFTTRSQSQPVWELDGTINIYLDHYLYIEQRLNLRRESEKQVDLATNTNYGSPVDTVNSQPQAHKMVPFLQSIALNQNRRVRSSEVHYFDHPQLGVVMQIRKMAQPTTAKPIDLGLQTQPQAQGQPVTSTPL